MKTRVLLLFLLMLFSSLYSGNKQASRPYRIEIKEESMLWDNTYIITQDSILITSTNRPERNTERLSLKFNKQESAAIEGLLKKIDLNTLRENYSNKEAPADLYSYTFTITFNAVTRTTHIYQYKQSEIFNLVQRINLILTDHATGFQIGYIESYFQH